MYMMKSRAVVDARTEKRLPPVGQEHTGMSGGVTVCVTLRRHVSPGNTSTMSHAGLIET